MIFRLDMKTAAAGKCEDCDFKASHLAAKYFATIAMILDICRNIKTKAQVRVLFN